MSGASKKIEEASKALDQGLIKKAVLLTTSAKTQAAHRVVVGIAKQCVADKEKCNDYCKEGAVQLKDMITPTTDNNDDLTEVLAAEEAAEKERTNITPSAPALTGKPATEKTDEELYDECAECHVATAAVEFVKIAETDECDGKQVSDKLQPLLDDQTTTPEKWIKTMAEITENATCNKLKYGQVLGELTGYLQEKDSEILKNLDNGGNHG